MRNFHVLKEVEPEHIFELLATIRHSCLALGELVDVSSDSFSEAKIGVSASFSGFESMWKGLKSTNPCLIAWEDSS